jgi:hypothetical protein
MRTIIEQIALKSIAIIIILVVVAIQIEVIKDALLITTTPPVYTMKIYTVVLAVGVIAYLAYTLVNFILDIVELYKKYVVEKTRQYRGLQLTKSFLQEEEIRRRQKAREEYDNMTRPFTPEEVKQAFEDRVANSANYTIEDCMPNNPIDLKFDKMEDNAKKVVSNLKKKRDVQK